MTKRIDEEADVDSTGSPSLVPQSPLGENVPAQAFNASRQREKRLEYTNWAERYTPLTLADAIIPASEKVKLQQIADAGEMPPLMLTGKAGIGKTAILMAAISDAGLDLNYINCGTDRGIDMVRQLVEDIRNRTVFLERRGVLLDELDSITADAQSAIRGNTLVGKSDVAVIVATANYPEKLTAELKNRFVMIDLEAATIADRANMLPLHIERAFAILDAEGVTYERIAVENIVKQYFPSARGWMVEIQSRAAGGTIKAPEAPPVAKRQLRSKAVSASVDGTSASPADSSATSDGAQLLDDIAAHLGRFIATSPDNLHAIALFVVHTHAHEAASHSPLLWFSSPEKRCGKSTALDSVSRLVPAPIKTSNISVAGMLRAIKREKSTFLVDEGEHALKANGHLHGILNLGHARNGVMVRSEGVYSTWAPKVVALIGALPDTLADRSIRIALRRRLPEETVERLSAKSDAEAQSLHDRCVAWLDDELMEHLASADPAIPEELGDRAQDNWRPMIAIADTAGGDWPSKARAAASALAAYEDIDEPSAGVVILSQAREWFDGNGGDYIPSSVLGDLARDAGAVHGTPKSCMIQVARILSPFNVKRTTFRESTPKKGYSRLQIDDAVERYLRNEADDAA